MSWARKGVKEAVVVPVAFTSDHIETLYELDQEYIPEAQKAGMVGARRAESLNDSAEFVQAMAEVVSGHLGKMEAGGEALSRQCQVQCHGCEKARCRETKDFFAQ